MQAEWLAGKEPVVDAEAKADRPCDLWSTVSFQSDLPVRFGRAQFGFSCAQTGRAHSGHVRRRNRQRIRVQVHARSKRQLHSSRTRSNRGSLQSKQTNTTNTTIN